MKLIVGLGNPGEKYARTRHNVGFMVLDELTRQIVNRQWSMVKKFDSLTINYQPLAILSKPQTFMNSSGVAVKKLMVHFKIKMADLWVVHDDLDLTLGNYKIQKGRGPREHGGLLSIYEKLGNKNFWHVRIGVDNRTNDKEQKTKGDEYVLQNITDEELKILGRVIENVVKELVNKVAGSK